MDGVWQNANDFSLFETMSCVKYRIKLIIFLFFLARLNMTDRSEDRHVGIVLYNKKEHLAHSQPVVRNATPGKLAVVKVAGHLKADNFIQWGDHTSDQAAKVASIAEGDDLQNVIESTCQNPSALQGNHV